MANIKEKLKKVASAVEKGGKVASEKAIVAGKAIGSGSKKATTKVISTGKSIGKGGKAAAENTYAALVKKLDQDGNGILDSSDLILMALAVPGVKINRETFLRRELKNHCSQEEIDKAVKTNPATAGIKPELIDKLVDANIKAERTAVSGISAALGMPGGVAVVATIPADIAQYYGYMLRAAQKMMYLYGFPELDTTKEGADLDASTLNSLTICLGIMYGVAMANTAIKAMAKALATGVEKQLIRRALTKGTIYPIVKSVAKWFSVRMTKQVFAGFFKKAIPVVGGVIGGGLTFATFKPCCNRLKNTLKDTKLSNPEYKENEEEEKLYDEIRNGTVIDVEPEELIPVSEDFTLDDIEECGGEDITPEIIDEPEE